MGRGLIGVDLGQKRDPTAVAVAVPQEEETDGRMETHFLIRLLERLPLGTPYPQVADRVERITAVIGARTPLEALFLDATGVGQPVVDLLAARSLGVAVTPVFFTYGDRRTVSEDGVSLGKAYLVSRLQTLFDCDRLHLPKTSEAAALKEELLSYEIRVDQNANDRYGAFKVGTHDDLVTALGLAVQVDSVKPDWSNFGVL